MKQPISSCWRLLRYLDLECLGTIFGILVSCGIFYSDVVTDILSLIQFDRLGYMAYFWFLLTFLILERVCKIAFQAIAVLISGEDDCLSDTSCVMKLFWFLSPFIYLDELLDSLLFLVGGVFEGDEILKNQYYKRLIEGSVEAIPSQFIIVHSIFWMADEGHGINNVVALSLLFSIISSSLFQYKFYCFLFNNVEEFNSNRLVFDGKICLSFYIYLTILIQNFGITLGWGLFTMVTRPYGVYVQGGAILAILIINKVIFKDCLSFRALFEFILGIFSGYFGLHLMGNEQRSKKTFISSEYGSNVYSGIRLAQLLLYVILANVCDKITQSEEWLIGACRICVDVSFAVQALYTLGLIARKKSGYKIKYI